MNNNSSVEIFDDLSAVARRVIGVESELFGTNLSFFKQIARGLGLKSIDYSALSKDLAVIISDFRGIAEAQNSLKESTLAIYIENIYQCIKKLEVLLSRLNERARNMNSLKLKEYNDLVSDYESARELMIMFLNDEDHLKKVLSSKIINKDNESIS